MSQAQPLTGALEEGSASRPFKAGGQKMNRDFRRGFGLELGAYCQVHRSHTLVKGESAGCVLQIEVVHHLYDR